MIDISKEGKKQIVNTICLIIIALVWAFTPFFTDPVTYGIILLVSAILTTIVHSVAMTIIDLNPPFVIYVYDKEEEEE
ncbi:MAG: hypothetical protein J7J44_02570 [Deltaproteobacteria bacterium]|nr:hypothetical protein [Deltaproteobacteria bacterium]